MLTSVGGTSAEYNNIQIINKYLYWLGARSCEILCVGEWNLELTEEWEPQMFDSGVHRSGAPCRHGDWSSCCGTKYLWALSMELDTYHLSGAYNFWAAFIFFFFGKFVNPRILCVCEVQRASSAWGRRGGLVDLVLQEVKFPGFQSFLYGLYFSIFCPHFK